MHIRSSQVLPVQAILICTVDLSTLQAIRLAIVAPHVAQAQPHSGHVIMWAKDVNLLVGTVTAAAATMENLVPSGGVTVFVSVQPRELPLELRPR